jgi:hypothetical protein
VKTHPVIEMGRERVPLSIIDDAHDAPQRLQDAARSAPFARGEGDQYPGVRAAVPEEYGEWLAALAEQAGVPATVVVRTNFAIASDGPNDLSPIQRIPHFDTPDPAVMAAVHYLCAPPHDGTGFYRHHRTGFERIDASRQPAWRQGLASDARNFGVPDIPCGREDTALFALIGVADLRFNRVIFYPANCLHSGIVRRNGPVPSPHHRRVTVTSLLRVEPTR